MRIICSVVESNIATKPLSHAECFCTICKLSIDWNFQSKRRSMIQTFNEVLSSQ